MTQFLITLAAVLLLLASLLYRQAPANYYMVPHLGWLGLFFYVLVAALGSYVAR